MMYHQPLPETVVLLEDIVLEYVTDLVSCDSSFMFSDYLQFVLKDSKHHPPPPGGQSQQLHTNSPAAYVFYFSLVRCWDSEDTAYLSLSVFFFPAGASSSRCCIQKGKASNR